MSSGQIAGIADHLSRPICLLLGLTKDWRLNNWRLIRLLTWHRLLDNRSGTIASNRQCTVGQCIDWLISRAWNQKNVRLVRRNGVWLNVGDVLTEDVRIALVLRIEQTAVAGQIIFVQERCQISIRLGRIVSSALWANPVQFLVGEREIGSRFVQWSRLDGRPVGMARWIRRWSWIWKMKNETWCKSFYLNTCKRNVNSLSTELFCN